MPELYEWTSDDSCELCDALDGCHEDEPDRPHRYCDCQIDIVDEDWDWDFEFDLDSSGEMDHFQVWITVTCHMPNEDIVKEDYIEFDLPKYGEPGSEEAGEEKFQEIEDRAEQLASSCFLVS